MIGRNACRLMNKPIMTSLSSGRHAWLYDPAIIVLAASKYISDSLNIDCCGG